MSAFGFCDLITVLKFRSKGQTESAPLFSLMTIPSGVLSQFVFPFLKTKDVVRLDTAILNKQLRPHFYESFAATDVYKPRGVTQFIWFVARKFVTEGLHITHRCSVHEQSPIWSNVNMIKRLDVDRSAGISPTALARFLNSCCELERLLLCPHSVSQEWGYKLLIMSDLKLTTLELVYDYNPIPESFFVSLLQHCPRLQVLRLSRSSSTPMVSILYTIAQCCPCLQELRAFHGFQYTWSEEENSLQKLGMQQEYETAVRFVLHQCRNLTTLGSLYVYCTRTDVR